MAKEKLLWNWEVVIEPVTRFRQSDASIKETCEAIAEQVKRHCDNVDHVHIEHDEMFVCSFCGEEWWTNAAGCPQCCDEAQVEWTAAQEAAKTA